MIQVIGWPLIAGIGLLVLLLAQPVGRPAPTLAQRLASLRPDQRPSSPAPTSFASPTLERLLVPPLRAAGGLLLRAAEAASQSGDFRRAVSLAREAVDTIDATVEPARAAHAHGRLCQFLIDVSPMRTGLEEILGVCGRAVELAPRDPPTRLRARVTTGLAEALVEDLPPTVLT